MLDIELESLTKKFGDKTVVDDLSLGIGRGELFGLLGARGLLTATIVKSSGAATGLSFLFILPQMLLGTFVPAPQLVGRLVPRYYVTDALTSIFLRVAPPNSPVMLLDLAVVAALSIAILTAGILAFSRFGRT